MQHICAAVERGDLLPGDVTEDLISNSLYTAPYSQVDLLVRTSGTTHVVLKIVVLYACRYDTCVLEVVLVWRSLMEVWARRVTRKERWGAGVET